MFLLGGTFLKNYYSIWDDENGQMALVPHIHTTATVTVGTAPTATYEYEPYSYEIPVDWSNVLKLVSGPLAAFGGLAWLSH